MNTSTPLKWLVDRARPPLPYDLHGRVGAQRLFSRYVSDRGRPKEQLLIDVGSGPSRRDELSGLAQDVRESVLRVDLAAANTPDVVADAERLPFGDNSVDAIVLQGVLEHVPRPWVVAHEVVRALKPGGLVFCEAPFVQWRHDDPGDYFRFTEEGLRELFAGCECLDSGVAIGPASATVGIARELIPILFSNAYLYWSSKWIGGWLMYPFVLVDRLYRRRPRARTIALAVYVIVRKTRL